MVRRVREYACTSMCHDIGRQQLTHAHTYSPKCATRADRFNTLNAHSGDALERDAVEMSAQMKCNGLCVHVRAHGNQSRLCVTHFSNRHPHQAPHNENPVHMHIGFGKRFIVAAAAALDCNIAQSTSIYYAISTHAIMRAHIHTHTLTAELNAHCCSSKPFELCTGKRCNHRQSHAIQLASPNAFKIER